MTKYFCDKCKEEKSKASLHVLSIDQQFDMSVGATKDIKFEICGDCQDKLLNFLKHE